MKITDFSSTTPFSLFFSLGFSPAIITEFLFAIWRSNGGRYNESGETMPLEVGGQYIYPKEIILCTTKDSKEKFEKNREEFDIRLADFFSIYGHKNSKLPKVRIKPLGDIIDPSLLTTSDKLDDLVLDIIKEVVKSEDRIIFCLTGGRVAMSVALSNALNLFKRSFDSVYDIQVNLPFTSQGFWFPYPKTHQKVKFINREGKELSSFDAVGEIKLTEQFIPPILDLLYSGKKSDAVKKMSAAEFKTLSLLSAQANTKDALVKIEPLSVYSKHKKNYYNLRIINTSGKENINFENIFLSMTTYLTYRIICRFKKIASKFDYKGNLLRLVKSEKLIINSNQLTEKEKKMTRHISTLLFIELISIFPFISENNISNKLKNRSWPAAFSLADIYDDVISELFELLEKNTYPSPISITEDIKHTCSVDGTISSAYKIKTNERGKDEYKKSDKPHYAPVVSNGKKVSEINNEFDAKMSIHIFNYLKVNIVDSKYFEVEIPSEKIIIVDYNLSGETVEFTPEDPAFWAGWWASEYFDNLIK